MSHHFCHIKFKKKENIGSYIKLKVYASSNIEDGGVSILEGEENLKKFYIKCGYENKHTNEVEIIGKTPFKELNTFSKGDPSYNTFYIYGELKKCPEQQKAIFNVKEWYPTNNQLYVFLLDTLIWDKYFSKLYFKILLIILILIITAVVKKSKYN